MKKNSILKSLLISGISIGLVGSFILPGFVLADSCPSQTTVTGTTVTFVGELTDLGGDGTTSVWFQYGQTTSYGKETSEKVLTQPGFYCITISGLLPSTTYHYRAAARNTAGTTYGEDKSFTTTSGSTPTVDIEANGSDGPITIPRNNSASLTWNSSNADSCYASGAWSGSKSLSGSQSTGSLTSSKTYTLTCTNSSGSASDSVTVNVGYYYDYPTVDIEANGSDGPITIPYNNSARLTWNSSNADSCYASGAWSGSKSRSGSQSTGRLTSSKTYTLNCTNSSGSASDSVTVYIDSEDFPEFTIKKTVRNLSRGTTFSDLVYAEPGEMLVFGIVVDAENHYVDDVVVKDTLPSGLIYRGSLRVNNVSTSGNILTGLNIGDLAAGQRKTITFRADVAGAGNFAFGQTELTNRVSVTSEDTSRSDNAKVSVSRPAVAGVVTQVPTGLTNNFFFDSLFLPLLITLLVIWLLKSHILRLEEWIDLRKKQYQVYKSNKTLQLRIAQAKAKEFLQQRI